MKTLYWQNNTLYLLDQTRLPLQEVYLPCCQWQEVYDAIRTLAVRGAPAIGVAAAYAVVLAAREIAKTYPEQKSFLQQLQNACGKLQAARPTAINLRWAVQRMLAAARSGGRVAELVSVLEKKARQIEEEDIRMDQRMAAFGADELSQFGRPLTLLTHCNAGALATAGMGTALGVIRALHRKGLVKCVYVDETRPLLQGARLTVTELMADQIPVTLITDNMAAWTMKTKAVDAVITGADRIAANGDTANKIGTYGLSILAAAHHIPFYVAAPSSTFDFTLSDGSQIPIEERNHEEVRSFGGVQTALPDAAVFNPSFDVTPHENITALITERGVLHKPDAVVLKTFFKEDE